MTISTRNNFFLFYIGISIVTIFSIVFFTFQNILFQIPYEELFTQRSIPFRSSLFIFKPHFHAVIFSILFLSLYAPITLLIIFRTYEKTQAPEIIFFSGFLFASSLEIFRFVIPFIPKYTHLISIYLIIGKVIFFSRLFSCLCFLFAAIFTQVSKTQDVDKNIAFLIILCIIIAAFTPINTTKVYSSLFIQYGFIKETSIIKIFLYIVSFFTFFITGYRENIIEYKKIAYGAIIISIGYYILCVNDNIFFGVIGCISLTIGTHIYLNQLHKYYLWK
ncbi:MAG: hypothetical protein ACRC5H_03740 [Treponemataceae bacterium]